MHKKRPSRAAGSARAASPVESLEPRRLLAASVADFEGLSGPVAGVGGVYVDAGGYRFANRTSAGNLDTAGPRLYGPADGFASKVIQPANWGERVVLDRPDGAAFSLAGFDYAASVYGDRGDFAVTGTFADGTTRASGVSFAGKSPQTLSLNWTGLKSVTVNFDGGVNAAFGTLDNFRLDSGPSVPAAGPASVSGSLANPNPVAGPLEVRFDAGANASDLKKLVTLSDGRFYSFGYGRAAGPFEIYAVRHLADGQIDRTFGDAGRVVLEGVLRGVAGNDFRLVPLAGDRFAVDAYDKVYRYDANLRLDASFGTGGSVSAGVNSGVAFRPDGGFILRSQDRGTWRVYDAAGTLKTSKPVVPLPSPADNPYAFNRFDVAADGSVFLLAQAPFSFSYFAFARLKPDLTLDTAYGSNGVARFGQKDAGAYVSSFKVAPDGRLAFVEEDVDGDLELNLVAADGRTLFAAKSLDLGPNGTFINGNARDLVFNADGDVSVAYSLVNEAFGGSPSASNGFAVARYNADGSRDARFGGVTRGLTGSDSTFASAAFASDGDFLFASRNPGGVGVEKIYKVDTGPGDAPPAAAFGNNGLALIDLPSFNSVKVLETVPTPDGGVYAIGWRYNAESAPQALYGISYPVPFSPDLFVARLDAAGRLDAGFSGDGLATPGELGWPQDITGLTSAPGGGYLGTFGSNEGHFRVGDTFVKLRPDFTLDPRFGGGDGIAQASGFGPFDVRPDGKIAFVGLPFSGGDYIELYNADGSLQGGSRRALEPLLGDKLSVSSLAVGGDNSVFLVAGNTYDFGEGGARLISPPGETALLRYAQVTKLTPSLNLDTSFATGGRLREYFSTIDFFGAGSQIFVGGDGRTLTSISEDDSEFTAVATDSAGKRLPNFGGFATGTAAAPDDSFRGNTPVIAEVGFTDDGGFAVGVLYHTSYNLPAYSTGREEPNAFTLTKLRADGSVDPSFGTDGVLGVFNSRRPIQINDAAYAGNGKFFVAGGDDDSTYGTFSGSDVVTQFGQNGSVRLIDVGGRTTPPTGGTNAPVTVDFENAPLGNAPAAGYADPSGFRFTNIDGGGPLSPDAPGSPLKVYGPADGFPSRVIQPDNWGRAVAVSRPDGRPFDLASFDYAASVFGDNGDFAVLGRFADGSTRSLSQAFGRGKTPKTLALNWTGLSSVIVNYAGGTNGAFGTLDNFKLSTGGGTTNPPPPVAKGFVVEAEASVATVDRPTSRWQPVAGGVGGSIAALPDVGQNYKDFGAYSSSSARADYQVTLPSAGRYYLWARGRGQAGMVGDSNSVHFGLGGQRVATAEAIGFDSDSLEWSNDRYRAGRAYIDVAAGGTYTLNLWMREDGVVVDRFLLTSDANYTPTGNGPAAGALA